MSLQQDQNNSQINLRMLKSGDADRGVVQDHPGTNESMTNYKSQGTLDATSEGLSRRERIFNHIQASKGKYNNQFSIHSSEIAGFHEKPYGKRSEDRLAELYNVYFRGKKDTEETQDDLFAEDSKITAD